MHKNLPIVATLLFFYNYLYTTLKLVKKPIIICYKFEQNLKKAYKSNLPKPKLFERLVTANCFAKFLTREKMTFYAKVSLHTYLTPTWKI